MKGGYSRFGSKAFKSCSYVFKPRFVFQEKVLKQESEYHEKELLKLQKEQELNEVRRQHEKEIYALKKKLHEASIAANNANK